ncbi:MAG: alkaline phosphatase [Planctomycetaceae bacterium]|jgi:alkaline phosphatase|nr:alkaline phosphatase [Planctomycetaceae bacterium]
MIILAQTEKMDKITTVSFYKHSAVPVKDYLMEFQMTRFLKTFAIATLAAISFVSVHCVVAQESVSKPKNIILMIGDGMGFNHYISGAYWRYGELGRQAPDSFPVHCAVTTSSAISKAVPNNYPCYNPEWFWAGPKTANNKTELTEVTDSSSAATAIYSGVKTIKGRVAIDVDKNPIKLAAEAAHEKGKATGAVSTVPTCHATPGTVYSHNSSRDHYEEMFNFMVRESGLDVIIGAGHPLYDDNADLVEEKKADFKYVGGVETWEEITKNRGINGFTFVDTRKDFEQLANPKNNELPKKLLGIAHARYTIPPIDGNPSSAPASAEVAEKAIGNVTVKEVPTLTTTSLAALNVLSQNKNGFFVMIEGGAIDGAAHANNAERMIYEQTAFVKAVEAVADWVEENSSWEETLLIITADHETGYLWGDIEFIDKDNNGKFDASKDEFVRYQPIEANDCGQLPKMKYFSKGHTNSLVPLWAKGANAKGLEKYYYGEDKQAAEIWNFSGKYIDNTHIGKFMLEQLQ